MLLRCPVKKKIADPVAYPQATEQVVKETSRGQAPQSLEDSLDAQAEALAASFPVDDTEPAPKSAGKSESARLKANQAEIKKLVDQLPERVRDQMEELFRARYTRIQKLDLEIKN